MIIRHCSGDALHVGEWQHWMCQPCKQAATEAFSGSKIVLDKEEKK